MRLLNARTFKLEEVEGQDGDPPVYAILSHRWRAEEVLFDDMQNSCYRGKKGFAKVQACCQRTLAERYDYVWIDTCCIDRKSSAELSEAINSMYNWYRNAQVCYAYLDDCLSADDMHNSEWFKRGWTLQELIAPPEVLLFNSKWGALGPRWALGTTLSAVTGIDRELLVGEREAVDYSVAQRMSWAANRMTTRIEDKAYCLMGLFDVNMPILYGEGPKSFIRLQEEIIKQSDDYSLFAWSNNHQVLEMSGGLLAPGPDSFYGCGDVVQPLNSFHDFRRFYGHFFQTSQGLSVRMPMLVEPTAPDTYVALLNCTRANRPDHRLGIFLTFTQLRDDPRCVRVAGELVLLNATNHDGIFEAVQVLVAGRPGATVPKVTHGFFIGDLQSPLSRKNLPWSRRRMFGHDVHLCCRNPWSYSELDIHLAPGIYSHQQRGTVGKTTAGVVEFESVWLKSINFGFDESGNPTFLLQESPVHETDTDVTRSDDGWILDPKSFRKMPIVARKPEHGNWVVLRNVHRPGSWYFGMQTATYCRRSALDDCHLCVRIDELGVAIAMVRNVIGGCLSWTFSIYSVQNVLSPYETGIEWSPVPLTAAEGQSEPVLTPPLHGWTYRKCINLPPDVLAKLAHGFPALTPVGKEQRVETKDMSPRD